VSESDEILPKTQAEIDDLRELLGSRGFSRLQAVAQAQVDLRVQRVLRPLTSLEDLFQQESLKGEIAGLKLFLATLPALLEDAERRRDDLLTDPDPKDETNGRAAERPERPHDSYEHGFRRPRTIADALR